MNNFALESQIVARLGLLLPQLAEISGMSKINFTRNGYVPPLFPSASVIHIDDTANDSQSTAGQVITQHWQVILGVHEMKDIVTNEQNRVALGSIIHDARMALYGWIPSPDGGIVFGKVRAHGTSALTNDDRGRVYYPLNIAVDLKLNLKKGCFDEA